MMLAIFKLAFIFALTVYVNARCSYPCNWQKYSPFFHEASGAQFTSPNPSIIRVSGPSITPFDITCLQRSGPFILSRRGAQNNQYRCIKIIDVSDESSIVIQTDLYTMTNAPDLCDICTPEKLVSTPEVWVAKSKTHIGCNVPKNCPADSGSDNPCTGCEQPQSDDGMCCDKPDNHAVYTKPDNHAGYTKPDYTKPDNRYDYTEKKEAYRPPVKAPRRYKKAKKAKNY